MGKGAQVALLCLFTVLASWEAFVHISGMSSPRGMQWNASPVDVDVAPERLWNWSDPQFLAAFRQRQRLRGLSPLPLDAWILMAAPCSDRFAGEGISGREPEFRWTDGYNAEILFAAPPGEVRSFTMDVQPLVDPGHPMQQVGVELNGTDIGSVFLTERRWTPVRFKLPPGIQGENTLSLRLRDAHSPPDSGDARLLGIAIRKIALTSTLDASNLPVAEICK